MGAQMRAADRLSERLANGEVVLIDGGMGTELQARGVPMNRAAWSGVANLDNFDVVQQVHEDNIRAGADVIIANSFATSRVMFRTAGLEDRFEEANRRSVEAAIAAREAVGRPDVVIAGSVSDGVSGASDFPDQVPLEGQELRDAFSEHRPGRRNRRRPSARRRGHSFAAGRGLGNVEVRRPTPGDRAGVGLVRRRARSRPAGRVPEPAVVAAEMTRLAAAALGGVRGARRSNSRCATPPAAPSTGYPPSSRPFSGAMEPTHRSAVASRNCSDQPGWRTSACRSRPRPTRPGTPDGPSGSTSCRTSAGRSWRWG